MSISEGCDELVPSVPWCLGWGSGHTGTSVGAPGRGLRSVRPVVKGRDTGTGPVTDVDGPEDISSRVMSVRLYPPRRGRRTSKATEDRLGLR